MFVDFNLGKSSSRKYLSLDVLFFAVGSTDGRIHRTWSVCQTQARLTGKFPGGCMHTGNCWFLPSLFLLRMILCTERQQIPIWPATGRTFWRCKFCTCQQRYGCVNHGTALLTVHVQRQCAPYSFLAYFSAVNAVMLNVRLRACTTIFYTGFG